jgi:hypothetical protein
MFNRRHGGVESAYRGPARRDPAASSGGRRVHAGRYNPLVWRICNDARSFCLDSKGELDLGALAP